MQAFFEFLKLNPYILLFFTVGMAVFIGKFSFKGYGLGMVAAAVVVGAALSTARPEILFGVPRTYEKMHSAVNAALAAEPRMAGARIARFLPEDKVSEIDASIGELLGLHPNIWNLIQRTNDMIRELARAGHVIVVGRGGNFATAGIANGLHVRLVAPTEQRADHMARELGVTFDAALLHNSRTDGARRSYVRSVFDAEIDRASAYDLVLNMGTLSCEQAADQVFLALRNRLAVPA